MRLMRKPLILGAASLIALSACTDPAYQQGGDREKTGQGAAIGAAIGGLLGATKESGDDRVKNAAVGAAKVALILDCQQIFELSETWHLGTDCGEIL